ncbi:MAG: aminoacyl-histidine dipeptidase [Oscillibacter sp.]|nr:aminoacyl-histidine dipeptidase [Oscillibacter sp.]
MYALADLEPKAVMRWFEEISAIPRGSMKEEKIAAYIMEFARQRGLACSEDAYHNVLVRKAASPGREQSPALILQSHVDMICANEKGVEHDFEHEGLELYVEGDRIRARGTTLGADDGIGVAYQLAILDDETMEHPAIEAVFTTAEEIGMVGASYFDMTQLTGKRMINFDAGGFTEGRIYVGCAGNQHGKLTQKFSFVPRRVAGNTVKITLGGLLGGHSGGDIGKGRGNSSVILGRLLSMLLAADAVEVAHFGSGDVSQENKNGIPAECSVVVCTDTPQMLKEMLGEFEAVLRDELSDVDDGVSLTAETYSVPIDKVVSRDSVAAAVRILSLLPNGVQSMQRVFPDTPECSCNIGNVEMGDTSIVYYLSIRSCKESLMDVVCEKYRAVSEVTGSRLVLGRRLPSWDYDKDSFMRQLVNAEYIKAFGVSPRFKVTHASTECALFKTNDSEMDIISMGPIIYEEHTPNEYMGIESVGVLWTFIRNIIKQL